MRPLLLDRGCFSHGTISPSRSVGYWMLAPTAASQPSVMSLVAALS